MFQQQLGISNFKGGIQILKKEFRRYLKDNVLIQKLKNEKLFTEKLLPDIQKQAVFPAIRENGIYFYYYNSLLFEYDGKFKTHPKFAFVPSMYGNSYVSDGNEVGKISNFYDGNEAKHFTNGEIWSNSVPAVVNQVNRYNIKLYCIGNERKINLENLYNKSRQSGR